MKAVLLKGKLIKWNKDKAFGFIKPNGGGDNVFIHKTALSNQNRKPQVNDIITFSILKDQQGRYSADAATFYGEKLKKHQTKKVNKFSLYLSITFLSFVSTFFYLGYFSQKLVLIYFVISVITFLAYAFDKFKAKRGAWRTHEKTLHIFSLLGGWPGAAIAQQLLRHKSQKRTFLIGFWYSVITNLLVLFWLVSPGGLDSLIIIQ